MAEPAQTSSTVLSSGRRILHPFVAYGVGAMLFLTSTVVFLTAPDEEGELLASPAFTQAVDFFVRNPDVEMSDRLAQLIGRDLVSDARAVHEAKRRAGGVPFLTERMRGKTQRKFDVLERAALESLEDLPSWRFGVGRQGPISNWFMHVTVHEKFASLVISFVFFTLAAIALEGAWGSLLFGGFLFLLPLVSAGSYRLFFPEAAAPWAGPSAVIAGLLGAYFVRSFRGFVIPGWIVVPIWIVVEYLLARDISLTDFDTTPVVMHSIAFSFGCAVAFAAGATRLEHPIGRKGADSPVLVSNPVLEQALQVREDGNPDAAFALLEQELGQSPENHDVAVAFWDVARRLDRCGRAVPAMLGAIRACLRSGMREQATTLWNTVVLDVRDPKAESTLLVRVGEALIAEGYPDAGLRAFGMALDAPRRLSSILATRVVRSAQPLDPDLAGRAAAVALVDDQLDPHERRRLKAFVEKVEAGDARVVKDRRKGARRSAEASAAPAPEPALPDLSEAPTESLVAPTIDHLAADLQRTAFGTNDPGELDPYQDPHALGAEALQSSETEAPAEGGDTDPDKWNQPGTIEDLSSELEDLSGDLVDEAGFDWDGLNDEQVDELASDVEVAPAPPLAPHDRSETTETTETTETIDAPLQGSLAMPADGAGADPLARRALVVRHAVPVKLDESGFACEIDGGGKTVLPFDRIDAVSVAAVEGLSDKPVILIDLALNWLDAPDAPLKVIRLRSDGFDPRRLASAASAIEALREILTRVIASSSATPLPSPEAARGNPFQSFPSLERYQQTVLMAEPRGL